MVRVFAEIVFEQEHIKIISVLTIYEIRRTCRNDWNGWIGRLIEDLYGSCGKCKHLGLNYLKDTKCPGCGTTFKYLATRAPSEVGKILARIRKENLPFKLVEKADLEKASAGNALYDLFKT